MRPEHAPAREVPVPQPAAAAVERGVDARAHGLVDHVGLARARRLPVEGEAEDQHDEAGGGGERHRQRGVGAPGGERLGAPLQDRELAVGAVEIAQRAVGEAAVGERNLQHAGGGAEGGERLGGAEHVDQAATDHAREQRRRHHHRRRRWSLAISWRMPATITPSPFATSIWRPCARAQGGIMRSSSACSTASAPGLSVR